MAFFAPLDEPLLQKALKAGAVLDIVVPVAKEQDLPFLFGGTYCQAAPFFIDGAIQIFPFSQRDAVP